MYILIVVSVLGMYVTGSLVSMQEFTSKECCELARSLIVKNYPRTAASCVEK